MLPTTTYIESTYGILFCIEDYIPETKYITFSWTCEHSLSCYNLWLFCRCLPRGLQAVFLRFQKPAGLGLQSSGQQAKQASRRGVGCNEGKHASLSLLNCASYETRHHYQPNAVSNMQHPKYNIQYACSGNIHSTTYNMLVVACRQGGVRSLMVSAWWWDPAAAVSMRTTQQVSRQVQHTLILIGHNNVY